MKILNSQHLIIEKFFPNYNREKSEILVEGGSDASTGYKGCFYAHIFRKGYYHFDANDMDNVKIIKR